MKWMRKSLMRLLSAGTCLALVAGMLPAALAARPDTSYEVESDEGLKIDDEEFNDYCKYWTDGETMDYIVFTDLPSSREGTLYYEDDSRGNQVRVREGERSIIMSSMRWFLNPMRILRVPSTSPLRASRRVTAGIPAQIMTASWRSR